LNVLSHYFQENPIRHIKGDIKAFFKSLLIQSFSGYGFRYIRFLIKALIINWRNFPLAVNLAIKGHHFFKFTDQILADEEVKPDSITHSENRITDEYRSGMIVRRAEESTGD